MKLMKQSIRLFFGVSVSDVNVSLLAESAKCEFCGCWTGQEMLISLNEEMMMSVSQSVRIRIRISF
jgi:hypothetical protein